MQKVGAYMSVTPPLDALALVAGGAVVYRERTAASIPSKFETVLHMGPREKNGFWGRTLRFTESDVRRAHSAT